jgi:2OG-Fe(II) oxygenase superfamily
MTTVSPVTTVTLQIGRGEDDFYLDPAMARATGESHRESYISADPFPHIIFDNFLPLAVLDRILDEFPKCGLPSAKTFDAGYIGGKGKVQYNPTYLTSPYARSFFLFLNSEPFLDFVESVTNISGLISDPFFDGGGFHEIGTGGKLGIHADFRIQRRLALQRRVNVLIYLNQNWRDEWGGQLELWNQTVTKCVRSISPIFNRCVIFNTDAHSFHGHPDALNSPEGVTRKSIALYYYTASKAVFNEVSDDGTDYRVRPKDDWKTRKEKVGATLISVIHEITPPVIKRFVRIARGARK